MRECIFRGKRTDNGEWVYGYFCGKVCDTIFSPAKTSAQIIDKDLFWHEVLPETVGEFTGLTDKNGKKIFEGDILEVWENEQHKQRVLVFFEKGLFVVSHYAINLLCGRTLTSEVIGNINDNPDLSQFFRT